MCTQRIQISSSVASYLHGYKTTPRYHQHAHIHTHCTPRFRASTAHRRGPASCWVAWCAATPRRATPASTASSRWAYDRVFCVCVLGGVMFMGAATPRPVTPASTAGSRRVCYYSWVGVDSNGVLVQRAPRSLALRLHPHHPPGSHQTCTSATWAGRSPSLCTPHTLPPTSRLIFKLYML